VIGWIFLTAVTGVLFGWAVAAGLNRTSPWAGRGALGALAALWVVTAGVMVLRFSGGMGAMTNMSDTYPWGVWVGFLQAGVALSGGGFVMAATVHIFHIKRFEPILRPVVLLAFLGYSFVAMTLFIEVGRPYNLWHPLAMWQHHSIMFEVAWCVTLYLTVLAVEFSPAVLERLGLHKAVDVLHRVAIPIVIVGVILSTLHQSSMGSMFLIVPQKIHPLWYSPLLPVFFLISSVAVGLCVTVVASFYSARLFGKTLERWLLADLARAASWILFLYGVVRVVDISARGAWARLFDPAWLGGLFLLEVGARGDAAGGAFGAPGGAGPPAPVGARLLAGPGRGRAEPLNGELVVHGALHGAGLHAPLDGTGGFHFLVRVRCRAVRSGGEIFAGVPAGHQTRGVP
jgi:formate-dependent nitrite reductase membrane component NrfD